jgi:hypothetical protein
MATPQLLRFPDLDYLVYDYLAEITMSIMARARATDATHGYAGTFVTESLAPNLQAIAGTGVKILSNAGGVNPIACADAIRALLAEQGIELEVAVVTGDDLLPSIEQLVASAPREMNSGEDFPAKDRIASVNAYLGAGPIAEALRRGADIVVTGRCADSALALAACLHAFDWQPDDWDRLAAGSLAGHLLECGPQATGGNFTDWRDVADSIHDIGYPVAEIAPDGDFVMTKPAGTGGAVTNGTLAEQLVYEIEDPQAYVLPDVVCDFSAVRLEAQGKDRVHVSGALGMPATDQYKVSVTWLDGFRAGMMLSFTGSEAADKARSFASAALTRATHALRQAGAPDMTETSVEVIGAEDQFGDFGKDPGVREVVLKMAARHADARGVALFIKVVTGLALATPPGLALFNAGRPRPSPVVRLFSFLVPKVQVRTHIEIGGAGIDVGVDPGVPLDITRIERPAAPIVGPADDPVEVPLFRLAWARSGDKGDRANIGVIARRPDYLPWIWAGLSEDIVAARFRHYLDGHVERFLMPGPAAINYVLHEVLGGGGVASLRNDPQGKAYAQILLETPITVPKTLLEDEA